MKNYDSKSERLGDDSTFEERFEKYGKILIKLESQGIYMRGSDAHTVNLEDPSCGFKLGHGKASWDIFRVDDVVSMIVESRNDFIKRKENENN